MRLRSAVVVLVACVLVVGPQCKPRARADARAAGADGGSRDDDGAYDVVRSADGGETRVRLGAGPIPPEFPPGTKLYPGASFSSTSRLKSSVVIMLHTHDSADAVFAFYRAQPGFEETSDAVVKNQRVVNFKHHGSGKELRIVVKADGARTQVSLVTLASP
jgi:hypothetical protein